MGNLRADRSLAVAVLPELRSTGSGWRRGSCPYCEAAGHRDRKASFGVAPSGYFSCFRCGVRGWVEDRDLDVWGSGTVQRDIKPEKPKMGPPDGFEPIWDEDTWEADCFRAARRYLVSRGIDREFAQEVGIGAVLDGRYHHRVIIPVLGLGGEWVGWVGRIWRKKAERPYTYPEGSWRAESLFNHAALRVETDVPVFAVEGAFDSLALWPDSVAMLGTPSAWQIEALAEARRPVVVAMDGDAWRGGRALALQLMRRGARAGSIVLPPGADPDELPRAALDRAAEACIGRLEPVEF